MRFLLVILLFWSGPLWALSCIAPDMARDFQAAHASDERFVIVEGFLTFSAKLDAPFGEGQARDVRARIEGHSLGLDGFKNAFETPVTLRVSCAGPWCGSAQSGARYAAFLKKENGSYVAFANPCGGMLYRNPTKQDLDILHGCLVGTSCEPKQF